MRTNIRIPIVGIVPFSWYRIAEGGDATGIATDATGIGIGKYHVCKEAGLPSI